MSTPSDSLLPVSRPPEYGAVKNKTEVSVRSGHDGSVSFHSVTYEVSKCYRPKKVILNSVRLVNLGKCNL